MTLAWTASSNLAVVAYNVYSGTASQVYTNMVSFGNVTNATLSGLVPGTTYYFSVTAVDSSGMESPFSNETTYLVPATTNLTNSSGTLTNTSGTLTNSTTSTTTTTVLTNTPPTITGVANQTINMNTSAGPLAFWVGDLETPFNLEVFAACSNPTLVDTNGLVLVNNGTNWTLTVSPTAGQSGSTTISLTVCDPSLCTTTNFLLTVLPPPVVTLTSPTNGTTSTAPATVQLSANVIANGHSIVKVQFFNGSSLLGESSVAPYTCTWNSVGAGMYSLAAQVVFDVASTVASAPANLIVSTPPSLPAPWQTMDIGSVGASGSAVGSNGVYTLQGAGNLSGSADNFRFMYQTLSGDGEIRAQLLSAQNSGAGDYSAVMIRESLTSGSRYAAIGLSPGSGLRWQRRANTGGGTSSTKAGNATPPNVWLRLVRTGNTLSGYKSTDGTTWTLVNSSSITMASNIYVGLAVASGSSTQLTSTSVANVAVVP